MTELSRFSELRVIARHSSFHYKDKEIMPGQIARELGVGYILQGSVRRGRDRVRITAQLTDATTGAHVWAERYDRTLDDVFAIQDEVVRTIAPLLVAHVRKAEVERTLLKPPATWQAYHYFMRGLDLHLAYQSSQQVAALHEARRLFEQSIAIDPAYARPYSALAVSHLSSWANYGDADFLQSAALERAQEFARHAVQLDPQLAYAQATFAHVLTWGRQHEVALGALDRALLLNPSYSHWQVAAVLMFAGELDRAVDRMQAYMQLDPYYPTSAIGWLGVAYCTLGRFADALSPVARGRRTKPQARHVPVLARSRVRPPRQCRSRAAAGHDAPRAAAVLHDHRHRPTPRGFQERSACRQLPRRSAQIGVAHVDVAHPGLDRSARCSISNQHPFGLVIRGPTQSMSAFQGWSRHAC